MSIIVNIVIHIPIVLIFFYAAVQACQWNVLDEMIIGILAGIGMLGTSIIIMGMRGRGGNA